MKNVRAPGLTMKISSYISTTFSFREECEDILIKDIDKYRSYQSVKVDASFDEIYQASLIQNFIPIVDDRNVFIGLIRRKEVVSYIKKLVDEYKKDPNSK